MALSTAHAHAVTRRAAATSPCHPVSRRCPATPARRSVRVAVLDVNQSNFQTEVLEAKTPVLVDFWAPWCGPCKLVAPLMAWAEQEHKGALKVVKVEHGPNPELIEKYKVYGLPTFIMFKDGQEVPGSKAEGAIGKAQLTEYIKKHAALSVSASL